MNEPIARLAPYAVLHPDDFHRYIGMILQCAGAPRDTDWRRQLSEVRLAIERTNPTLLGRLFSSGHPHDSASFKFAFSVLALHVGYAMSPKLREYLRRGLQQICEESFYPPIFSADAKAEIRKLCNVLHEPHTTPVVNVWLEPPQQPLESGDQ